MPELGSYSTAIYLNLYFKISVGNEATTSASPAPLILNLVKNSSADSKINIAIADKKDSFHILKIRLPHGRNMYF